MPHTEQQIIDMIRNAAEWWWFELPKHFRWDDGTVKVPALKQIMRQINGVGCTVGPQEKGLVRWFERLDNPEIERFLEKALWIYRVGYRTREMEETLVDA